MASPLVEQPYVGPRPFKEDDSDRFFGRDREARDLAAEVLSDRLLLFYAQSGAGKSSLINTRLIPSLRSEGFDVLPVGRVAGEIPPGVDPRNVFAFNLVSSLAAADGRIRDRTRSMPDLAITTFTDFLGSDAASAGAPMVSAARPTLLIIDQFEDLFTTHHDRWRHRTEFFVQLRDAQEALASLWVVLTMREDFIAHVDQFAALMPNGLRSRFHMQRMRSTAALKAVAEPARAAGHAFAPDCAQRLVDNLCQVRRGTAGDMVEDLAQGEFVEPVQLQVVCYQLWERLRESGALADASSTITNQSVDLVVGGEQQLSRFVNQALGDYYEQALGRVLATDGIDVSERELRDWFSNELITPDGTRGMVFQTSSSTGTLKNRAVQLLADQFLIRAEPRAGGVWYELVHDRFVQPIVESNHKWLSAQTNQVIAATRVWLENNRDPSRLLSGKQLEDAQRFAEAKPRELGTDERTFLKLSSEAEGEARLRELRQARRTQRILSGLAVVAALCAAAALVTADFAVNAQQVASTQRLQAEAAQATAVVAQQDEAAARALAEALASDLLRTSRSRLLAAQAVNELSGQLDLALLLSRQAYRTSPTVEARASILGALEVSPLLVSFLHGNTRPVNAVAFSPDGTLLASAGSDRTIRLWEVATRAPHGDPLALANMAAVRSVAFSPNGQILASVGDDKKVNLWDPQSGTWLGSANHPTDVSVYDVAFQPPDGKLMVTVGRDQTAHLWDVHDAKKPEEVGTFKVDGQDGQAYLRSAAFSADGTVLAIGSSEEGKGHNSSAIYLWDVASRQQIGVLLGHNIGVLGLAFSPIVGDMTLASGGTDQIVRVWNVATRQLRSTLTGHTEAVDSVAFSQDGTLLASASEDHTVRLWDARSGKSLGPALAGHASQVRGVAFNRDDSLLATAGEDHTVRLWDVADRQPLGRALIGHRRDVLGLEFSPDGSLLVSSGWDNTVRLWDPASLQPIEGPPPGLDANLEVHGLAFSHDGSLIAWGDPDGMGDVRLWDVRKRQLSGQPLPLHSKVYSIAFSPDDTELATASQDGVRFWDVAGHALLSQSNVGGIIFSLAYSPDGKLLATGSSTQKDQIQLWDAHTHQKLDQPLSGHSDWVKSVAFSPDGKLLASASRDQTIRFWDVATRQISGSSLTGHTAEIEKIAFSPDGTLLASAAMDGTIRLWDTTARRQLTLPFVDSSKWVWAVAFSPDGKTLAWGDSAHNIVLRDINTASALERVCRIANRDITQEEWVGQLGPDTPYEATCP